MRITDPLTRSEEAVLRAAANAWTDLWKFLHRLYTCAAPFGRTGLPRLINFLPHRTALSWPESDLQSLQGKATISSCCTYASDLCRLCWGNLEVVQDQLGHASVKTTTIYAKVSDRD
jgi:hypothetical protein